MRIFHRTPWQEASSEHAAIAQIERDAAALVDGFAALADHTAQAISAVREFGKLLPRRTIHRLRAIAKARGKNWRNIR